MVGADDASPDLAAFAGELRECFLQPPSEGVAFDHLTRMFAAARGDELEVLAREQPVPHEGGEQLDELLLVLNRRREPALDG